MEDWLKKELSDFVLEPQKESWEKIIFQTELTPLKKHSKTRYVLTLLCVCVTFLCLNVLTIMSPRVNKGAQKVEPPNLTNNQTQTSRVVASQLQKFNQKNRQDLTKENKQENPTQTAEQKKINPFKINKHQIKHNLSRKKDLSGLSFNFLTTMPKKQVQIKKLTKLNKAKQKPYAQINYKLTTQNRLASTNILSHKLEGLVFGCFRDRFSVGLGLGLEKSKWNTQVGKTLNKKWFNQNQNNPGVTSEERDFFVDSDTVFINNKSLTPSQESSKKNNYWNNSFYAQDGKTVQVKENTLWLLSLPVRLRFDVLRKKDLVFRVTGTVNPQIIFNQNSVASHDELNVWVEDKGAFKKLNTVYEGSIEFEKRINKNRYNLQLSAGFNPLKKQAIYKNEKLKNSVFGSIGLGCLFGK